MTQRRGTYTSLLRTDYSGTLMEAGGLVRNRERAGSDWDESKSEEAVGFGCRVKAEPTD